MMLQALIFFMSQLLFVNVATDCLMSDEKILIGRPDSNSGDLLEDEVRS